MMTNQSGWQEILPQPKEGSPRPTGTFSINVESGVIRFGRKTTEYWWLRNYKSFKAFTKPNEPGLVALQFYENGDGHWALRPRGSATMANTMDLIRTIGMKSGCYRGTREKIGFAVIDFNQPVELFERKEGSNESH